MRVEERPWAKESRWCLEAGKGKEILSPASRGDMPCSATSVLAK
jgi:hypothetical protein